MNFRNYVLLAIIPCLALTLFPGTCHSETENWQYWKGPNMTGVSDASDWDPEFLGRPLEVNWRINVGSGYSNVAIYGEYLYTMGFDERTEQNILYCLEAKTGEEVWTYVYPSSHGKYTGPKSSPVIDGGLVYTLSQDGLVLCNKAATGELEWMKDLVKEYGAEKLRWEFSPSVFIEGNAAIINVCENGIALDKRTGELLWESPGGPSNYSSPVTFSFMDRTYAAIYGSKGLNAVDTETGEVLWYFPWGTTYNIIAADPVVYDGKIFISSGYGNGCALIDISSGKPVELWQNKNLSTHFSTAVIIDGFIYGIDGNAGTDGSLKCLDMNDGSQRWSVELGFGNMIAANGRLIMLNEKGSLFIAEASPEGYKEISRKDNILPRLCWTAPVLCRETIYLRNNKGELVSINAGK